MKEKETMMKWQLIADRSYLLQQEKQDENSVPTPGGEQMQESREFDGFKSDLNVFNTECK